MTYPRFQRAKNFKFVNRTAGDYALSSTTWANVDTGLDIVLEAQSGDVIQVGISSMWGNETNTGYLQVATIVSAAPVSWIGSGEPTTTTGEGISGWVGVGGAAPNYLPVGASAMSALVAGDISSATVTLRLRYRVTAATKTLRADANDPFQWWAKNLGPIEAH